MALDVLLGSDDDVFRDAEISSRRSRRRFPDRRFAW
jgi:hypothetical protein